MRKRDELSKTYSCTANALPHEMMFVLLGRDPAAPATILAWVEQRIARGLNKADDLQILDASNCANVMEQERDQIRRDVAVRRSNRDLLGRTVVFLGLLRDLPAEAEAARVELMKDLTDYFAQEDA